MRGISWWLRLLLLLPLALICSGQNQFQVQGTPQVQNQGPRRAVTGTVTNASSGEPIRHALVQLWGPRPVSALTGSDGRFEIGDVPEGPVNFAVTKPGFFDSRSLPGSEWRPSGSAFIVGSGNNDFRLTLSPAARIVGRITDSDGEAVEQIQVEILSEQIFQGRKQWQPRGNSNTNDDGSYRVDDLTPGRYIVFAAGNALPRPIWNAPQEVSAPAYYPDARDLVSAQPIEIRAGQEFRADFHLRAERGFRITGNISGVPVGLGLGISIQNSTGQIASMQGASLDQSRGKFRVQAVPSGTWIFAISASDGQGHPYEARQEVTVNGADVTDLPIVLHPAASIPVTVNHAANQPQSPIEQRPLNPGINAMLISTGAFNVQQYGLTSRGETAALAFDNVTPGKYKLDVQSYGSECLESATYGDVDVLRDYLVVGSDGETQPLTISLRSDCATLTAKIAPGEQQTSGFLLVVPSSSFGNPKVVPIATQSSLSGAGAVPDSSLLLSPGFYQVFAFSSLEGLEYANPEALRGYPSESITLDPAQKAELTLKLSERKGN